MFTITKFNTNVPIPYYLMMFLQNNTFLFACLSVILPNLLLYIILYLYPCSNPMILQLSSFEPHSKLAIVLFNTY